MTVFPVILLPHNPSPEITFSTAGVQPDTSNRAKLQFSNAPLGSHFIQRFRKESLIRQYQQSQAFKSIHPFLLLVPSQSLYGCTPQYLTIAQVWTGRNTHLSRKYFCHCVRTNAHKVKSKKNIQTLKYHYMILQYNITVGQRSFYPNTTKEHSWRRTGRQLFLAIASSCWNTSGQLILWQEISLVNSREAVTSSEFFYSTKTQSSADGTTSGAAWHDIEAEIDSSNGNTSSLRKGSWISRYLIILIWKLHSQAWGFELFYTLLDPSVFYLLKTKHQNSKNLKSNILIFFLRTYYLAKEE